MVIFMILMSLVLEEDVFRALNVFYCVVKLVIEQLCLWVCVLASNEKILHLHSVDLWIYYVDGCNLTSIILGKT